MIACLLFIAGTMVHIQATAQEKNIPAKIKATVNSKSGGQKILLMGKDHARGYYVATLESGSVLTVGIDGKWLQTIHPALDKKFPPTISAALNPYRIKGYEIDNMVFVEDATKGKYYNADVTSDEDVITLYIDLNGKVFKKEKR
mgnify:CR=1 FL=1